MKKIRGTPSVLFLVTSLLGFFLTWVSPWRMTEYIDYTVVQFLGLTLLCISLILNVLAYKMFKYYSTPYAPFSTPTNLIDKGIFVFSRNPVYLALVLSQCGIGFVFDAVWLLVMSIILFMSLHFFVVLDEEKLLEKRFKGKYEHYKERTRRWF